MTNNRTENERFDRSKKARRGDKLKALVLDSVSSPVTRRVYNLTLNEFITWYQQAPRPEFSKATASAWRASLESIYQNIEKGLDRVTAAIVGTKEVISAVFAATLTSIIIFAPLVFGKKTNYSIWLADTGSSIILALLCSLFISLTLIPLAVAKFLPARHIEFVADKTRKRPCVMGI